MGIWGKIFSKKSEEPTEPNCDELIEKFYRQQAEIDAMLGNSSNSVDTNIEDIINQANASETHKRTMKVASDEARKMLAELGITQDDLKSRIKISREDYIKPENINTENILSNILTYLGVNPELANNPIVKEKLLEEISGMKGFARDSKRQEWLKQFVDGKNNIKEQIIPGLQKEGYKFTPEKIKFAGDDNDSITIELKNHAICIENKTGAVTVSENYNLDNILIQRQTSYKGESDKLVEERDSKNPFILHRKTVGARGDIKDITTMGLSARGVVDMEIYLTGPKHQYGDESEQEFLERLYKESKKEMKEVARYDSKRDKGFVAYVSKCFPDLLCEEKQNDGRVE